ncbi:MAG: hypothetical protein QXR17_03970 [Candidatus Bathyarchaeia archaeon]
MIANSSSKSSDLEREVKKLRVRVDDYLRESEEFKKKLDKLISKLEEACVKLKMEKPENLIAIKREIMEVISEALKAEGEIQHERSHLLESYGAIILALEKEL